MKIGINASFLRKQDSGTGQVTLNFLRTLAARVGTQPAAAGVSLQGIQFILYLEENCNLDFLSGFEKRVFLPSYKRDDLIRKIWWEKFLLPKKVEEDGCDVFFSLYQATTVFNKTPLIPLLKGGKNNKTSLSQRGKYKNIRHVMLVHDTVWKIFPEYLNNLRKKIYYFFVDRAVKKADRIITVSENSKKDIRKYLGISEDRITVSYIDCDPIFKQPLPDDAKMQEVLSKYSLENKNYLFYMGGFDVRKNVAGLISAYGLCWKKYHEKIEIPDLFLSGKFHPHLVPLVTDIPGKIEEIYDTYGVPKEKISFEFVETSDMPAVYRHAALFCYPSLYEGFGIPPLEAMNVGCPVLTSNVSSLPEVAPSGGALLVDPANTEEIAEGMYRILTDEKLKISLIENGRKNAERFSWEKFTNKIMGVLVNRK